MDRGGIAAADLLAEDWSVESEVCSFTSFAELAREARWSERAVYTPRSHLEVLLADSAPAYPQIVAPYMAVWFVVLGTDEFGRSDTREALRDFFEVDRRHVTLAALDALTREGVVERTILGEALRQYHIDPDRPSKVAPHLRFPEDETGRLSDRHRPWLLGAFPHAS